MSDSVTNSGFDVEAQEALLDNPAEDQVSDDAQTTSNITARNTFMRLILLVRSTELFKLGAANLTSTSSTSASGTYESISTSDEILFTQGSEIVAASEISADRDNILNAHSASADYERTIDLQQRKNIVEIVRNKNLQKLRSFGGVAGVAEAINADLENGISSRREINGQPKPSQLSQFLRIILRSFLEASNNYTIFLLFSAAALSLGFGINEEGLHMGWFNGGVLFVTVFIIVVATTIRESWEKWLCRNLDSSWHLIGRKLQVKVVRSGFDQNVSEVDLDVGDIVELRKGGQVPADGLFVKGKSLKLDDNFTTIDANNPFLFYGSRVVDGKAHMLVTSASMGTAWGEMMSQANEASAENECKFESYLHRLNTCIQIVGLLISILIIVVLFLRYKLGKLDEERRSRPDPKGEPIPVRTIVDAIKGIITGSKGTARVLTTLLSVSLMGIMEGIPFAISIAAIVWSSRTLGHKASERDSFSCIKIASVTTVITDKFGRMTEKEKEIDKFCVGEEFVSESSVIASEVVECVCDGIGTQFMIPSDDQESRLLPVLSWAEEKLGMSREAVREQCKMMRYSGHSPLHEPCRLLMEKNGGRGYLHCNGPARDILSMCSHHYDIDGSTCQIDEDKRMKLERIRHMLAEEEAQVIAYACRDVNNFSDASFEPNLMILLAMISMTDSKMEDTRRAISSLEEAGIRTVLASSVDNIALLESIGRDCGIVSDASDDEVVTGEKFRAWSDPERMDKVESIRILGNCLPSDKILLIKCLKQKGEVVALLAQRTVDAPALKQADIGITYGTWSSEIARECSHLTIWSGDSFSLLVNIIKNGRCFQENIRKFIQLQLILTISSTFINFVAVVFWGDAPITAVQLFWLNLVVGLVGGLALLTSPSTEELTESSDKLMTKAMWRNIVIQVSYQTTMSMSLQLRGQAVLGASGNRVKSMIYNGFFLCQMFNKFLAREPENKNLFRGLFHKMHRSFWVALVLFMICQAIFAIADEVLGSSPGLSWMLWGACFLIGLFSWLMDWLGKVVSDFARWAADGGRWN